ncbi:hypothetical protein [Leptospira bandrabouensis]|uniref:hypothetical protein n=1 Tax=Leptospira bandrabouensis TaxID=2484903 RepID=UPI001EEAD845|nr:hypothetical protein [Leptospira bandrabouensis]MCG6146134.1 hypothetical protein [Leptospira bandrabouensis]MCG6165721.1 hypothetical protein [Leptospira bandrabouensis]
MMKNLASLQFCALTKIDECIDLQTGPQLSELIQTCKVKRNEALTKNQESV